MNTYDEVLTNLISFLARGGHSQARIAQKLNERELYRPEDNTRWNQTAIARFMQQHNITPAYKLTIYPPESHAKQRL